MTGDEMAEGSYLDLFSTSPTLLRTCADFSSQKCTYNAPYFAYHMQQKVWGVSQGNCHHWDCPRCGQGRAREEYGRIVEGCKRLAEYNIIYFLTITCKGTGLSVKNAEENYLTWTNRFLDACRQKCKRSGGQWDYVQVTERQKRGHPHSHILTTFCPLDMYWGWKINWGTDKNGKRIATKVPCWRSNWVQGQVVKSGLGEQYDISFVETWEGASRYVAKYLFKPSIFENTWPAGWKRVRYSQTFPDLPKRDSEAIVLLSHEDWYNLAKKAVVVQVKNLDDWQVASNQLHFHDTIVRLK